MWPRIDARGRDRVRRQLAWTLLFVVAVAAWGWLRPRVAPNASAPPPLTAISAGDECTPQDFTLRAGRGTARAGGVRFATSGFATLRLCTAGRLRFTLHTNVPSATLLVARGVDPLWLGSVGTVVPYEIEVTGPTWLAVAYLNDAQVEGRNRDAWIGDLHFEPAH